MNDNRWNSLMDDDNQQLTETELTEGWHFCLEFDGCLIGPGIFDGRDCVCGKPFQSGGE